MEALNNGILGFRELIEGGALRTGSFFSAPLKQTWHSARSQGQPEAPFIRLVKSHSGLEDAEVGLGCGRMGGDVPTLSASLHCPLSQSL